MTIAAAVAYIAAGLVLWGWAFGELDEPAWQAVAVFTITWPLFITCWSFQWSVQRLIDMGHRL